MQRYTHFRCTFDVSPAKPLEKPWAALVGEFRAWIASKEKAELKGFFFAGGNWEGPPPNRSRVEVKALSLGGPTGQLWAARYEHPDAEHPARRWTTDIGLSTEKPEEWRLSVELSHALRPGFVGAEPPLPLASSPKVVAGLLSSGRWKCRSGSQMLLANAVPILVGKAPAFAAMLTDPLRLSPIVLVSRERATDTPKLDADRLARALAGTATVHLVESAECDEELEYSIPYRFRSPNGTVRIYAPGVDFSKEWSASRHRFYAARDIDFIGATEVHAQIVRALTRTDAWQGIRPEVASIEDVDDRARERRLAELRHAQSTDLKGKDEEIGLYLEVNNELEKKNKALAEALSTVKADNDALLDKVDRLEFDLDRVKTAAESARDAVRARHAALEAMTKLETWPTDAVDIATLAGSVFADRLELTPRALQSLERSDFLKFGHAGSAVWECMAAMATVLHPLLMDQADGDTNAAGEAFKNSTKLELTWTETKETKKDNKLMAARRIVHDNREIDITPHVKWGSKSKGYLRVHFFVDRPRRRIVIGHCGDHLDTYGTRRRS